MLPLLMYIRTAWNDHFPEANPTNYNSQTYTSRQTPSDANIHISNCLFKSMTSSSSGGALYCTSATYFLVESTSFFSCKTTNGYYYGAIYFSNTNSGQSVLYKVCGYDCCTSGGYSYQFAEVFVKNTASYKNNVNYSSISRCGNSDSYHIFGLDRGKICCSSVNSSLNKCYRYSGISCWPLADSSSIICSLTYSSFADNNDADYNCVCLTTGGSNYEMKSCNVLRNKQGTLGTRGTIWTNGNLNIENSCILENIATHIFSQGSSSYTITISNCTVDSFSNNGYLTIRNTVPKSFILALNHMSTRNCHSEYDSAGTLTPIIQTPSSSKKQILCFTRGEFFYQFRLIDFFLLSSVFIFHFIYPYSSNYPYFEIVCFK
jgi:hypothetical protein